MPKKTGRRGVPARDKARSLHPMADCTVIEAAALIRCNPSTIYRLINRGEISAYSRNGLTLIEGESIVAMKERHRIKPGDMPETNDPDAAPKWNAA
ncbi:hypothetical protein NBRC116589_06150 [Ruegeria sp. HU-ET01832]|uniref:helix-turn-helix domain-containing protein n=1 Tax=Ruegeria sp. HU-ET01832 TaxID=3135906 RepID=UPI0031055F14